MEYFDQWYNRKDDASAKWLKMYEENPHVSDDIIPLSVADMEFQIAEPIKNALSAYVERHVLGYSKVSPSFTAAVAQYIKKNFSYEVDPACITTTAGVVPALATAVRTFSQQGDGVILFTPVYPPFYKVVRTQGRIVEACPLIIKNCRYTIDFSHLECLARKKHTTMILLCNPLNPGGMVLSHAELQKIADIALRYGLFVASDEIHAGFIYAGHKHTVFTALMPENSLSCLSASKTFNLAGLQCATIVTPHASVLTRFTEANAILGMERANVLGLLATETAYTQADQWFLAVKTVLEENIALTTDFFAQINKGFWVMQPEASFLLWISFKDTGFSVEQMYQLLRQADWYVNRGDFFGSEGEFFFRVNIGLPTHLLKKALIRLDAVLNT